MKDRARAAIRRRYGPPDSVLQLEYIEIPPLAPDMVLVRVAAASLNTADSEHLRGQPRVARLGIGILRPRVLRVGLDVSGRVELVGTDVSNLRTGDEVWADLFDKGHGAFAEYVWATESTFAPKPHRATHAEAAALPHSGVLALQALGAKGPMGDRVLINGGGGCVGPLAIQIAKSHGSEVTAVDHTDKLDLMRQAGADHVVDYTMSEITRSGERFDRILDVVGNRSVLRWRRCLNPGGRYVLIATALGSFFGAALFGAVVSIAGTKRMGVFMWRPNHRPDMDELARLVDGGALTPILDGEFALDHVHAAFQRLESGKAQGKVIVVPGPTSGLDALD